MRYKLRTLRLKRQLTLNEVAKAVGLTKAGYGNIETGRRWPSGRVIIRLEQFFGIPASELLAESDDQQMIAK